HLAELEALLKRFLALPVNPSEEAAAPPSADPKAPAAPSIEPGPALVMPVVLAGSPSVAIATQSSSPVPVPPVFVFPILQPLPTRIPTPGPPDERPRASIHAVA